MEAESAWQFWYTVRKAAAILERDAEAVITAELGISFGQFMVLSAVDAHPGPLIQVAIAEHLGLTKATVSRLIEQGARQGWINVDPDPASRRSQLISLTDTGQTLVKQGDAALKTCPLADLPALPEADIQAVTATLVQVVASLRATERALPPARHTMGQ